MHYIAEWQRHSHITISMLWGNTAYCMKLSGKDLRIMWTTESVQSGGLRKCPYYDY